MTSHCCRFSSCACWLPMVVPSLAIAYVRRRRDWLSGLLVVLVVMSIVPALDAAFLLFRGLYFRWWYALVLMAALASARVVDEPRRFDIWLGIAVTLVAIGAYYYLVHTGTWEDGTSYVIHGRRLVLYCAVAATGALCTLAFSFKGMRGISCRPSRAIVGTVALFSLVSTFMTLYWYWMGDRAPESQRLIRIGESLDKLDPSYRYAVTENRINLTGEAAGIVSMTSTASAASSRFEVMLGSSGVDVHHMRLSGLPPGITELVGGSFVVEPSVDDGLLLDVVEVDGKAWRVRDDVGCPIAFTCGRFITYEDLMKLDVGQRGVALLQAAVVPDGCEALVEGYAQRADVGDIALDRPVKELAEEARSRGVEGFWRNDYGFGYEVHGDEDALVYMSVPNDRGWLAFVDGEPA